jgi:hypothetical protein
MNQPPHNWRLKPCLFPGCKRYFRNRSGLTKHVRSKHAHSFPVPQPRIRSTSLPPGIPDDLADPLSSPHQDYVDLAPEVDKPDGIVDDHPDVVYDPPDDDKPRSTNILHPYLTGKFVCLTIKLVLITLSNRKAM